MKRLPLRCITAILAACSPAIAAAETVWISSLEISKIEQGWGTPHTDKSVDGNGLAIDGKSFAHGVGTHAESKVTIDLKKTATRFHAFVGVDDEVRGAAASLEFHVMADGKPLWDSGVMKAGDPAKPVDLDVTGVQNLSLTVDDARDGNRFDHADWADARLEFSGERPHTVAPIPESAVILTPKAAPAPRITGAKVFGVRPGAPFLYTITAAGEYPMEFGAGALPPSLHLDPSTGQITGSLPAAAEYVVNVRAKNSHGTVERKLRLVAGEHLALTPPMGWNSWNCWAEAVDQEKVLRSARALVSSGLSRHGWTYVNIDDTWQGARDSQTLALQTNKKFPDMKGLCDEVHHLGLKAGVYSTPWITSYADHAGGSAETPDGMWEKEANGQPARRRTGKYSFAKQDARQWAAWGFDYLKYDWHPIDIPAVREMSDALRASGRDIVYSLSNNATFESAPKYAELANCWRTTDDIRDTWQSMSDIGFSQDRWVPFAGRGHWNDPDMLVVGYVGWGPKLHPSQLTPNEQYTHISLWCLLSAPLLIGCDLDRLDEFTLGLLTNDEVLDIDQDPLGKQAMCVVKEGSIAVYSKELEDGSRAVGLFNLGRVAGEAKVSWPDLGVSGKQAVRDLWRQQDVGVFEKSYSANVPPHGVVLVRVAPNK